MRNLSPDIIETLKKLIAMTEDGTAQVIGGAVSTKWVGNVATGELVIHWARQLADGDNIEAQQYEEWLETAGKSFGGDNANQDTELSS